MEMVDREAEGSDSLEVCNHYLIYSVLLDVVLAGGKMVLDGNSDVAPCVLAIPAVDRWTK